MQDHIREAVIDHYEAEIERLRAALDLQDRHIRGAIMYLKAGNLSGAMVCLASPRHNPDDEIVSEQKTVKTDG